MLKIGVIGDEKSVFGFAALGFDVFAAESEMAAREKFSELSKKDYGIIYVTKQYLDEMGDILKRYKNEPIPAIAAIPSLGLEKK